MRADEKDLVLAREFQVVLDTSPPWPSWSEIVARADAASLRWQRRHFRVVLAYVLVLLAIAVPALAYAAHAVFFASSPPPFQSAIDAFARIGGPPGMPANTPAVSADPRRVLTVPLAGGKTAALWVAPTIDHNYCFATQVVSDDADHVRAANPGSNLVSPGQGLDWGAGLGDVGCGKHDRPFDLGYDVQASAGKPPFILISGGSGLQAADSVEVAYQDGSTSSFPVAQVDSPVDAVLFTFQIPEDHTNPGSRPAELILRAQDNSILARDQETFSTLWRNYDQAIADVAANLVKYRGRGPNTPACWHARANAGPNGNSGSLLACQGYDAAGAASAGAVAFRPNSPGYQERNFEYPGNAHP